MQNLEKLGAANMDAKAIQNFDAAEDYLKARSDDTALMQTADVSVDMSNVASADVSTDSSDDASKSTQALSAPAAMDKVKEMIRALIASMRQDANDDADKQKFCAEQASKALADSKKASETLEASEESARWAENAVLDLEATVSFLNSEADSIKSGITLGSVDLDAELKRVKDEATNHNLTQAVIQKSRQVLMKYCKIPADSSAVKGDCAEANNVLADASKKLATLDSVLANYIVDYGNLTATQKATQEANLKLKQADLFQSESDLAKRKNELATLKGDINTGKNTVTLAGEASTALERSCGPQGASLDDSITRRQAEIDSLKNAVKVLEGEAFR